MPNNFAASRPFVLFSLLIALSIELPAQQAPDTLTLAVGLEPGSLDVHSYSTYQHAMIARLFAGALLDRDNAGVIVPSAISVWKQISPTEWLFTLRADLRFQNGSAVTSADVEFSLERTAALNRKDFATISRVETVDERSFRIVTTAPDPLLPSRLVPMGFIVPQAEFKMAGGSEAYFAAGKVVGFGPFKLVRWDKGRRMELESNPGYFGGRPRLAKIVLLFESSLQRRIEMLLSGEADIVGDLPPLDSLMVQKSGRAAVVKADTSQYVFGNFRVIGPDSPLADIRVRKALELAVDRQKLIQLVELGNGSYIPTVFVRQAFGYLDVAPYGYDPGQARDLLFAAGYAKGLSLTMLATSDLSSLAKALKGQFEAVGVSLEVSEIGRDAGILEWLVKGARTEDIFLLNPVDPMIDVAYHVETLVARYPRQKLDVVPKLAELFAQSNESTDPSARASHLREIQKGIYDNALYLFLWQRLGLYGVASRVRGFDPLVDGMLRLERVSLIK